MIWQRKTSFTASDQHWAVNRRATFVVPERLKELVFAV